MDQPQQPSDVDADADLLAGVRAGDERACARFVRRYGGRMLATATRLLGDPALAEDCVQEAFLSAFRAIDRFEGRADVATWLHRITVNAGLMKLCGRARASEQPIDDLLPAFDDNGCRVEPAWHTPKSADDLVAEKEIRDLVLAKIHELPENYRIVLLLRDIEDLSTQEAATLLELTENTVKVRLHRARAALKKLLEPVWREAGP